MAGRLLAIALLAAVAACVPVGNPPTDAPAQSPAVTSLGSPSQAVPSPQPTPPLVTPRTTATAPPPPTDAPATDAPASSEPMPRDALMTLPDGTQHAGALGSYFYGGAAADSPWLPARVLPALEAPAGSSLVLSVPPLEFVSWGARYADAADEEADVISPLASGGDGATPLESATLPAPPSGSWVVAVQLYFAQEEGDATYYWHVTVP
ncbi:MAG TPA: hypothetical protein VMP67_02875 [Candidatus Limnocylindria bacterium]|nr:hypothetical protein [Candidatus Limnocylindria bacterium]